MDPVLCVRVEDRAAGCGALDKRALRERVGRHGKPRWAIRGGPLVRGMDGGAGLFDRTAQAAQAEAASWTVRALRRGPEARRAGAGAERTRCG